MNSPALLISSTAAATASPPAADEAPAEDGFSAALASSIAGLKKLAECAPGEVPAAAGSEESPSLADIAQWLGLPGAATPASAQMQGQGESLEGQPIDGDAPVSQEMLFAAAAAKLAGPRGSKLPEADPAVAAEPVDGAQVHLPVSAAAALEGALTAPAGASSVAAPAPATASGLPQPAALMNAMLRDGATVAPGAAPALRASLHETVGSARWAEELGSRLVMMSVRGQQEGSLTLMPEHLGPLEIQISVSKDTANVWFGAQHADTRTALTEALPRLRELLAGSGLALGQTGVSEHAPRRQAPEGDASRSSGFGGSDSRVSEAAVPAWRAMRSGLIDTYA
jgi:flagellar hook-length control protein FliK